MVSTGGISIWILLLTLKFVGRAARKTNTDCASLVGGLFVATRAE